MSAPKKAAAKKAASLPASQKADVAPEGGVVTTVGDALAPTAEVTQPVPPLTDAGDGPAAAPGSEATLPSEQQPLTQPETETGLIDPQAGDTPPGDSNQPTDETLTLPPSDEEGAGVEGEEVSSFAGSIPAAVSGSEATLPGEQPLLNQPTNETGLIDPQAGDTPPGDSNQPTDADSPPPPPDQEGEGEVEMPLARVPDAGVIAEAAAYVTAPAESGEAVATGYLLPAPPDVRGHSRKRR